ncbi:GNAT family N-acetyltransferase [Brucella intermedia]|uniref:GNAT family N-acetyltransferase n=1 Tax=Brucella intermedia TaxID=94625 RepID=UPI001E522E26|nr:GNAT family N-acetyltransferase [Brucella intermedia]MCB4919383.1 GNAT family N-acetyltransferase [Brucella intermedia]
MTAPDKTCYCDFLAALPVSDGAVTIRTMETGDAEAYATGTEDALVKRYAHLPMDHYTPQLVRSLLEGPIADGLRLGNLAVLTIADANSDVFLGSLVFFDIKPNDEAEVGYWVAPEHRGQKVSGRALALAIETARSLGLKRLHARTVEENPASQRVLLLAGFEQAGEAQPTLTPSGKTEMGVSYVRDIWGIG